MMEATAHRQSNSSNRGAPVSTQPGPMRRSPRLGGRRSPNSFLERTTTVRFVRKTTGKLMCSKLNRVVRTSCRVDNNVCLCENFLKGHCEDGQACAMAHVPRQYLWDYLTPRVNRQIFTYEEGFAVGCYNPTMTVFYHIPSEYVYQTRGSERYIELYNDNGDNFKEKLRLCTAMTNEGFCAAGYDCEDVHCSVADLSQLPCIHTHMATEEGVRECERLPSDVAVRVFQPNCEGDGTTYPGDDVLRTVGATQYEEAYRREGGVPSVKMQHCAHFQNKKMCRLGDGCRFLHVVSLALSTPSQDCDASLRVSPIGERNNSVNGLESSASGNVVTITPAQRSEAALLAVQRMVATADSRTSPIMAAEDYATMTRSDTNTAPSLRSPPEGVKRDPTSRRSPVYRNNPYGKDIV